MLYVKQDEPATIAKETKQRRRAHLSSLNRQPCIVEEARKKANASDCLEFIIDIEGEMMWCK